ncbi:MAG: argininosuccinate lyase [Acidobacteriota bacterium]|nr:argininosuccinate lyase [Acidobacteriota bacterium]
MSESENLWGARVAAAKSAENFAEFNNSFAFDRRLFTAEIRVGISYCDALFHAGVLTRLEGERIKNGLQTILKRSAYDKNYFDEQPSEDVYSFVETRLVQLVGEAGRKLQIGRSRNDQSATALRLWLKDEIENTSNLARKLQKTLIESAEKHREAVLPAYAHLQRAQPILWAHWCLAYFEMLARDRERLDEVWRRAGVLPLGSATLAGTSFEIDREELAANLGFEGVSLNSLDAVSDRDFAVEFLAASALIMVHLSRLAEDLILYASSEFQFIEFSETVSTTSNLSAQKKISGALEFVRGKAGRIFGHHLALLTTLKGLPTGCSNDLQEDREAVFDTVDTLKNCLETVTVILKIVRVKEEKTREAASNGYQNATELVDYLIQKDVPILNADETVGKIVHYAASKKRELNELSLAEMQNFSAQIETDVFDALSLERTLSSKAQIGGTAPERVFEALDAARGALEMEE